MGVYEVLALALGVAWASGVNLYATVLLLGALNAIGVVALPGDLDVLSSPLVLAAAAALFLVEFAADKIPGVDSLWDALHTFIRIPAGALLAAHAFGGTGDDLAFVAALIAGGALAAGAHLTKAASRAVINTSPEPVSNWAASLVEDALVVVAVFTALFAPLVMFGALALFALFAIWLLPRLWRALLRLLRRLGLFGGAAGDGEARAADPPATLPR